jgi:hypothetical protein
MMARYCCAAVLAVTCRAPRWRPGRLGDRDAVALRQLVDTLAAQAEPPGGRIEGVYFAGLNEREQVLSSC